MVPKELTGGPRANAGISQEHAKDFCGTRPEWAETLLAPLAAEPHFMAVCPAGQQAGLGPED
jgi:hypothetical protein